MNEIDIISSRHATIPSSYKNIDQGSFKKALNGINCLGFSLQAVWTQLMQDSQNLGGLEHYLVRLAKWMSYSPAKLLGIESRRGSISKGKYADLIIWSPYEKQTPIVLSSYPETCVYSKSSLYGKIHKVYIRGQVGFQDGKCYSIGEVRYRR
jgi:dihydroorotase-like cyclic amidohydrolase